MQRRTRSDEDLRRLREISEIEGLVNRTVNRTVERRVERRVERERAERARMARDGRIESGF